MEQKIGKWTFSFFYLDLLVRFLFPFVYTFSFSAISTHLKGRLGAGVGAVALAQRQLALLIQRVLLTGQARIGSGVKRIEEGRLLSTTTRAQLRSGRLQAAHVRFAVRN